MLLAARPEPRGGWFDRCEARPTDLPINQAPT